MFVIRNFHGSADLLEDKRALLDLGDLANHLFHRAPTRVTVCAEHLRSQPLPPSVRLGRALPRDLEATLLDCLAKKPEDRPGSAEALRERLLACDVPPWTVDDARRWWQEHGAKSGPSRPSPSGRSTTALAVDLTARA